MLPLTVHSHWISMSTAWLKLVISICRSFPMLENPSLVMWPTPWLAPSLALVWTTVIPYLRYVSEKKNFDRLQRVQNLVARIVCGVSQRQQSARQLCQSLHWLPVRARTDSSWRHRPSSHGRRANLIISRWSFTHINHSAVYVRRHRNC